MIFVDTNVLLDVVTADKDWLGWSLSQLQQAYAKNDGLVANNLVYAEVSVRIHTMAQVDHLLSQFGVVMAEIPKEALFLGGKAFGRYREAGGTRTSILPDFLIGAHADFMGIPLLTRDARRFRTYFPALELITPLGESV